jgi:hypothetical protein
MADGNDPVEEPISLTERERELLKQWMAQVQGRLDCMDDLIDNLHERGILFSKIQKANSELFWYGGMILMFQFVMILALIAKVYR